MHPMLQSIRLARVELQALGKRVLSQVVMLELLLQAPNVVERQGLKVDIGRALQIARGGHLAPLQHGVVV